MKIIETMTNHLENPIGFDLSPVTLSWKVTDASSHRQKSARIRIADSVDFTNIVYDSGEREDADSLAFVPEIQPAPRTRLFWQVTVVSETGETAVSEPAFFETGLMDTPWQAKWITDNVKNANFVKKIAITKPVIRARAYASALGIYELYADGSKAGDEMFAPFLNDYDSWLQVETYELPQLETEGEHEIRVMLGCGWATGRFGFPWGNELYGKYPLFIAQIHIDYADGTSEVIPTDESWNATESIVRFSGIYDGETQDPAVDISSGHPATIADYDQTLLRDRMSPPVRVTERIAPVSIFTTPAGETVLDLGQEITGYLEFINRAPAGTKLHLNYFEILQQDNFYRENLRSALQEFTHISNGQETAVRPFHTFYGFRYVKLEGFDNPKLSDFTGCVIHSDIAITATVETSNPKVNRLALNALWGQRGNFLDVPTDCPQRDERMGWTGDAQVFCATASYQMHTPAFYAKYLFDMLCEQKKRNGSVPEVVPMVRTNMGHGKCAWSDAAAVIPWTRYLFFGDKAGLEKEYENMKLWVDWICRTDEESGNRRLWDTKDFQFADWLALDTKNNSNVGATDASFICSAYYYYSTSLLVKAAHALGKTEDEAKYTQRMNEVMAAIHHEYFTPAGRMAQTTQTAYVLALFMGFAPKEALLAKLLDGELNDTHGKLRTGFVGTAYLCRTLTHAGLNRRAYELLLNEEYPGWLYEVNMGATTVWERWNSVLPDGSISDTGMNSLNHYSYGAVMEWVYRDVAGLNPVDDAPGFRKAHIEPQPHYLLDRVKFRYNSAMGWYESSWEIQKRRFIWTVEIPFGAEAELVFPAGDIAKLTESHPDLAFREKDGKVTATAPSGRYHFDYVPTRPLHLVPSLDCTPAELMKIPGAKKIMLEAMPQLESKLADIEKMPPFPVRRILPRLGLSADMVAALDKKLAQLDT